jgi:hypothetical protein
VFLRAEGSLASSFEWQQLQPLKGSLLDGLARLPRQLLGSNSAVPTTTEAAQNARNTSDLLRRLREMGERVRRDYTAAEAARFEQRLDGEERRLRERRDDVEDLQGRLAAASRKAERLVREMHAEGQAIGDLGLSLMKLAKYEDEGRTACGTHTPMATSALACAGQARRAGMAAVRMSRLTRVATGEAITALDPLHAELAVSGVRSGGGGMGFFCFVLLLVSLFFCRCSLLLTVVPSYILKCCRKVLCVLSSSLSRVRSLSPS